MKKINFILAFCCLVAALNLQFKKPDYAVSADKVEAYSKAFLPAKKVNEGWICCAFTTIGPGAETGSGHNCMAGTSTCDDSPCKTGSRCLDF